MDDDKRTKPTWGDGDPTLLRDGLELVELLRFLTGDQRQLVIELAKGLQAPRTNE